MYESFYGLKEKPFSIQPDPEFLFLAFAIAWHMPCWSMVYKIAPDFL